MRRHAGILIIVGLLSLTEMASAFYDANLGRWLNRDPIEESGGLTMYGFVGNDPVNQIDAFGLVPFSYGNWCGYFKQGQAGPPIDEVDKACQTHDYCLATFWDFVNPCNQLVCNTQFCKDVADADCSTSPTPTACKQQKSWIVAACLAAKPSLGIWWYY